MFIGLAFSMFLACGQHDVALEKVVQPVPAVESNSVSVEPTQVAPTDCSSSSEGLIQKHSQYIFGPKLGEPPVLEWRVLESGYFVDKSGAHRCLEPSVLAQLLKQSAALPSEPIIKYEVRCMAVSDQQIIYSGQGWQARFTRPCPQAGPSLELQSLINLVEGR